MDHLAAEGGVHENVGGLEVAVHGLAGVEEGGAHRHVVQQPRTCGQPAPKRSIAGTVAAVSVGSKCRYLK